MYQQTFTATNNQLPQQSYRYDASTWSNQPNFSTISINNDTFSNSAPNNTNSYMNSFHTGFNYKLYSPSIEDSDQNNNFQREVDQPINNAEKIDDLCTDSNSSDGLSNTTEGPLNSNNASLDKRKQRRIRTTFSSLQLKELEKGLFLIILCNLVP